MFHSFQVLKSFLLVAVVLSLGFLASCSKDEVVTPVAQPSNPITNTTVSGNVKGTMLTGKTYTITGDVYVKTGDTLYVQEGVTVNVTNNAAFYIHGALLSCGTSAKPIYFTSPTAVGGSWGGFQCDSATVVTIKWTHIDYTGGPNAAGDPRKTLYVNAPIKVTVEDSWVKKGLDDGFRLEGGCMISLLRNTIESQGSTDGEAINVKNGATGIIAYNVVWSTAGSAIKVETNKTVLFPQTNVKVYNNTVACNGFRRGAAEPGRGILFDKYATGEIYNNMIVNNYEGLEIAPAADTVHIKYGNNYFFTTVDSTRVYFYPAGSFGKKQSTDIVSTSTTNQNPLFTNLDANVVAASNVNDFHLKSGSPALNKGFTTYNKDIGAYTSDSNGNKH
jgi:hypothetical protein